MAPFLKPHECVIVHGGPAGDHRTYNKALNEGDRLVSVRHIDDENLGTNDDLTTEFSIAGQSMINNDGGTDTSGDWLVVTWLRLR